MANVKNNPQEGTSLNEAIQSLDASAFSPIVSGGGNKRCRGLAPKKKENMKLRGKGYDKQKEMTTEEGKEEKEKETLAEMESDSDASVKTVASVRSTASDGQLWQKLGSKRRRYNEATSECSDCDGSALDVFKAPFSAQNRRKEFLKVKREKDRELAEAEIVEQAQRAHENREVLGLGAMESIDDRTAEAINKQVLDDVAIICEVATKSRNLKGTFQRALRDAAASIKAAVVVLHKRTTSDETAKLQADNARLQGEVAILREEIEELRKEFKCAREGPAPQSPRCPSPERMDIQGPSQAQGTNFVEEITRSIMLQVGSMMSARFEGLEERLLPEKRLRPPLAVDKRVTLETVVEPVQPEGSSKKKRRKRKGKKEPQQAAANVPKQAVSKEVSKNAAKRSLPTASNATEEGWSTVVKKGKKRPVVTQTTVPMPASSRKPTQVKLRNPRSAAVVLTLQSGAKENGVTYAELLAEARSKIDLSGCGIDGLRFRKAATGGCILEVPGATSAGKADSLAQKLREALNTEVVTISRPTKCAELRVTGLDDSATSEEIAAAIVKQGGCTVESVKVGELRRDSRDNCSVWVRCPVAAAKRLRDGGRLLVGWIAARIYMLQPKPMRCFRCLHVGHVRAQCNAEVDRSNECYRCGQPGHKAAKCVAAVPKCSICAVANKPADHRMGSKKCSPPKLKKRAKARETPSCPLTQAGGEEAMSTN